jgi:putative peptide zinc metalloprotease protein
MVLAALAALLWLLTQPGLFNQMCFNVMVLCSISTILLNGNPLLKFDGYYILADLCETPNLRDKSNAWITNWAQRRLLGLPVPEVRTVPGEVGALFGFYAVAAYLYTWVILFAISAMLFNFLEPYGLQFLSRAYVILFLFVSVALPLYRLGQTVQMNPDLRRAAGNRMLIGAGAGLAILLLAFLVPWRDEIERSAVLEQTQVQAVSAGAPGFLRRVDVREGQHVARGQLLAVLENADLETELEAMRLEKESLEVRLRSMAATPGEEARLAVPVLQRQLAEMNAQLAGTEERWRSLELRSPLDGAVRTPRPQQLVGKLFPARQAVLQVGQSAVPRILIALDEKEARRVEPGQPVKVVFDSIPGELFTGTVSSVPASPAPRFTAPSLANLFGGDVPSEMDTATKLPVPALPHYEIEASVDVPPEILERLRPQSSGRASIRVSQISLAAWIRDRIVESIHPDVRL